MYGKIPDKSIARVRCHMLSNDQRVRRRSNQKLVGRPTVFRRTPPHRVSRPVSRVLCGAGLKRRRVTAIPLGRRLPGVSSNLPGRPIRTLIRRFLSAPPLFGFAPGGVCRAASVAGRAVRSYRTVSPLPACAEARAGGLFSVALSLGSPPPDIIRHRMSMEPGLSSPATFRSLPGRPSGRLTI